MLGNVAIRRARLAAMQARSAGSASSEAALLIREVTLHPVREPASGRRYTILRLRTQSGLTGYGECSGAGGAELELARRVVAGSPATAYEVLARGLEGSVDLAGALNMALLDIVGKAAGAPVHQILGGPTRFKVRVMTPLAGDSDSALLASLKRAMDGGYRAFVAPVPPAPSRNQGQAWVFALRKRLEALREAGGGNADFVLGGGGALSPGDSAVAAAEMEKFHLLWFDEPCALSSLSAVKKISAESVTPVGFGKTIRSAAVFQDLLREDAIDVIRPDVSACGITGIRRMAALAETYYVAVAPHHDGGPVATAAALHLAASLPNFYIQQIPQPEAEEDRRMRMEMAGGAIEIARDGFVPVPAGPGLGISLSEAVLEKYRGGEA